MFGSSGGLGEAAAWLCLRQDLYVSLTTQQPLRTNLENFHSSSIFTRTDDFAWSSRMVFLLARVLQNAFADSTATLQIQQEVDDWYASKPLSFKPVRVVPRETSFDHRFPQIWMLLPVHGEFPVSYSLFWDSHRVVIGLQYYHIAQIILALSDCSKSSTYDNFRHSRGIEVAFTYLFYVCTASNNHLEKCATSSLYHTGIGPVKLPRGKHTIYSTT